MPPMDASYLELSSSELDGKSASRAPRVSSPFLPLLQGHSSDELGPMLVQKISDLWNQNAWVEVLTWLPESHHFQNCGPSVA